MCILHKVMPTIIRAGPGYRCEMNSSHSIARRWLLVAGVGCTLGPTAALAVQRRSLEDPMLLGADDALMQSGFARTLQRAFGVDTGIAVQLTSGTAVEMLEATELGDVDALLSNAPWLDAHIEKQGLVHDRRPIATGSLVLVGPSTLAKALDARRDIALALQRLAEVQTPFLSGRPGSGSQLAEQALWRAAAVQPDKAWHQVAASQGSVLAQAKEIQACLLMERGAWLAQGGGGGYGVLVEGDPRLSLAVHVMRSFRINHPAGKLFVNWIAGAKGRRVIAGLRGYRLAT